MFPELTIERVFRRELDSLSLPDEQVWLPTRRTKPSAIVAVAVAAAALVLVVAAAGFIREASGTALASTPPSVRPSMSCEPPAFSANTRCAMLLPNGVRNPAFGYNLTIPGEWRETQMPPGTEPFIRDRPNTSLALNAPFLLDRRVFTARPPREWVGLPTVNVAPAWDLDVQVWDRQGGTAVEWAATFGPCNIDVPNYGTTGCVQTTETIRGATFVKTTISTLHGPQTTSYYLERGDRMLILRYWTDPNVAPPPGVTGATLDGIVHSIGLV
jgi:hypothetical protein